MYVTMYVRTYVCTCIHTSIALHAEVIELQATEEGKLRGSAGNEKSDKSGGRPPRVTNSLI